MKRIFVAVFCLGLAAFVLAFSVWRQTVVAVKAQTGVNEMVAQQQNEPEATTAGELAKLDEYYLVYPGILPDHPLYFMKMARDRVRWWLTSDPYFKAELALLLADKRIGAAEALAKGGKMDIAVQTAVKAEQYFVLIPSLLQETEKEKASDWDELLLATYEHERILLYVREHSGEAVQSTLSGLNDRLLEVRNEAERQLAHY